MRTFGTGTGGGKRALRMPMAVAALYALVMQAFLGGIAALPAASAPALPFAVHCLDHGLDRAGESERSDPAPTHAPAHHHGCCCTAAQPMAGSPPLPVMASIAWPPQLGVRLVWRMASTASARAPPRTLASARAPPLV